MSGSLNFITSDPVTPAYQHTTDWLHKQRDYQEGQDTDAAIRSGIGDMLGANQPPHPLLGPNAAPASQALPSATAGAPNPPPDAPMAAPAAWKTPATPMGATGAYQPPAGDPNSFSTYLRPNVQDSWAGATQSVEDPSGTTINPGGYAGKYQFGAPALMAAGAYTPAAGENVAANEWKGQITLPGRAPMAVQQFAQDGGAQDQAMRMHEDNLDRQVAQRGLGQYIGTQVNGVTVTKPMLYTLMHFAGPAGAQRYLQTGGAYNPTDANNTPISGYASQVMSRMQGGVDNQPQPYLGPQQQPMATPVSYQGGSDRYNPVLARLAQTPGGGAAAMKILGEQAQLDRYGMERQQQYQHLAMTAFSRGDTDVGNYYAQLGGLNIPPQVLQNNGMRQRMATAALTAQRLYKDDLDGAQRFTQAYTLTGDVNQALAVGGEPKTKTGKLQTQWVQDPNDPTGPATLVQIDPTGQKPPQPVLGPDNQPLRQSRPTPRPSNLELKSNLLVRSGMYTPEEAAAVVAGAAPKPGSIGKSYQQLTQTMLNTDPSKIATDLPNIMAQMWGPDWQQKMTAEGQGMPGGARPAIGPGAAPAAPQQPQAVPPPQRQAPPPPIIGPAAAATPAPAQAAPPPAPATSDLAAIRIQQARSALARGAPRNLVIEALTKLGIPVPGDL